MLEYNFVRKRMNLLEKWNGNKTSSSWVNILFSWLTLITNLVYSYLDAFVETDVRTNRSSSSTDHETIAMTSAINRQLIGVLGACAECKSAAS